MIISKPCYYCKKRDHTTANCPRVVLDADNQRCFNCGKNHSLTNCDKGIVPSVVWHNRNRWTQSVAEGTEFIWDDPRKKCGKSTGHSPAKEDLDTDPEVTVLRGEPWVITDVAMLLQAAGIPQPLNMSTKGRELKLSFLDVCEAQKAFSLLDGQGLQVSLPPGMEFKAEKWQQKFTSLEDELKTLKSQMTTTHVLLSEMSRTLHAMQSSSVPSSSTALTARVLELEYDFFLIKKSLLYYTSVHLAMEGLHGRPAAAPLTPSSEGRRGSQPPSPASPAPRRRYYKCNSEGEPVLGDDNPEPEQIDLLTGGKPIPPVFLTQEVDPLGDATMADRETTEPNGQEGDGDQARKMQRLG